MNDLLDTDALTAADKELAETRGKTVGMMLRMSETEATAFRDTCRAEGYGQAEVLRALVKQWVRLHKSGQ